jgi:hypothetical protein
MESDSGRCFTSVDQWTEEIVDECDAYSVAEFCRRNGFSSGFLYGEWRAGRGPRYMRLGDRRIITREAAADWRREMEAATHSGRAA